MTSFGKCQQCKAIGKLDEIGTLDPDTTRPVVLKLCRTCASKTLHLNREQRRDIQRDISRAEYQVAKWGKVKPKKTRARDDAKRIRPKKPSTILVPSQEPEQQKPAEKRSKGGIIIP